ncbi:hypothetical protein POJ06DRAFT_281343 [Lipomyces tetrasporus]|uniref:SWIM-type domain-containing protein n=1 Tax=Lipomyces tetrasporus TaxID=54092 RepID=A0AAD7VTJ0_9ASCO|nr:uncharacterized protein POJ06DRAFT_281343 [Lipomyces tetrasporus]KAJ8100210.1 hypothetical protein POJ06DRAFT_281343 [Lipomyces tetrasporus]
MNQLCRWHVDLEKLPQIASSADMEDQDKMLTQLQTDHRDEAVNYFLTQWCVNGQCERWAEIQILEGSHGAMKGTLSSSSRNFHTAGSKINHKVKDRADQLSILCSNESLRSRLEIRNQPETANLCTAISRSALDIVYAEVMKMRYNQEEEGTKYKCNCATSNRYLLPCSYQILFGVSLFEHDIHPRWRVHPEIPPLNAALPRKGRPRGTRRLRTSTEKGRRCGSCHNVGHNRRRCPGLSNKESLQGRSDTESEENEHTSEKWDAIDDAAPEDDVTCDEADDFDDRDAADAAFEAMWADTLSLI